MALTELENRQWRIVDEPWPYREGRSTAESVQLEQDLLAGRVYLEATINRSVTRVWLDADWDEDDNGIRIAFGR